VDPATGFGAVYLIEIVLLFVTLIAVGPLVRTPLPRPSQAIPAEPLAAYPG
jgi:BCD family chlorophyll transporter-like MFS transporter